MKMSLGLSQSLELSLELSLSQSLGESSGDIPLYSLHKMQRLLRRTPPSISPELLQVLMRSIIRENKGYKEESGNDWSCLTSTNLIDAITATELAIDETISNINSIPSEQKDFAFVVKELLTKKADETKTIIRTWFSDRTEQLEYDMNGQIPWPIVQRLRRGLSVWISGVVNPFQQSIEEMVLDTAKEQGIDADNAEDAWVQMGGTIFKPK